MDKPGVGPKIKMPEATIVSRDKRRPIKIPVAKVEIGDEFDWCEWNDMKKSTLTYLRKLAKRRGEKKEITLKKLEAVRNHHPKDGRIVTFNYKQNGVTVCSGITIKKRLDRVAMLERKE